MNLSTKRIYAAAGGIAVVLVLIWYVAVFRPQSSHLQAAHRAQAAADQQIGSLQSETASLQALLKQIPADTAKLAALNAAVPATPDLQDVLNQLNSLATATGVQLTSVSPTPPATTTSGSSNSTAGSSGPPSMKTSLTANGPYPAVYAFMAGLAQLQRTVVVDSISLSPGTAGAISANLVTRIFYAA